MALFRKNKKVEDDYYYDDYYYDEYYYDEDEYEEDEKESPKKDTKVRKVVDSTDLEEELTLKEAEIARVKKEKEDLTRRFSSVQALPKRFQEVEEENKLLQSELAEIRLEKAGMLNELSQLTEKNSRAEGNVRQFQREVNLKQTELDQLTEALLNTQRENKVNNEVEAESQLLRQEIVELGEELKMLKEELDLKQEEVLSSDGITKDDIAEVMLEAKATARQIVEQAKYDSRRIVTDAERDLNIIARDARTLHQRILSAKTDSESIFEELLIKLTVLSDVDRIEEE